MEVVGESFCMDALTALVEDKGIQLTGGGAPPAFKIPDLSLRVVPEPDNEHDPNAIKIMCPEHGKLGYLARTNAVRYVDVLTTLHRQHRLWCEARVGGVFDERWLIGVRLNLDEPDDLTARYTDS